MNMESYSYKYPHPAVATDCVVFGFNGRELKVLLIERGIEPYKGMWAFPGGFMRMDESAEDCARRELKEETGLDLKYIKQLGAFSGVNRDPRERVVSIAFYSLARQSEVRGGDDAVGAKWWSINEVPQLAFDHDFILRQAMNRLRQDIHFEPIGFGLLEEQFTIADLQRLYESVLGVSFDRRNFYRKILQTGILQEVDTPSRPEKRYYGKRSEMMSMDIDALFAPTMKKGRIKAEPNDDVLSEPSMLQESFDDGRLHNVGRKGKLYRFVKEKYDNLKEGGKFHMEF
ncbi:MAG: NUDIX hydrolase [Bacteroidales bacterium]|nr:NUDIX hydrolase [Bacteroidales bacterium]